MRSSHTAAAVNAVFDDENLIGYGGLEPAVRLAERCGLPTLVDRHLHITGAANSGGACATAKVMSVVAGMLAGADSIDDLCDMRVHVVSESVVWRSVDVDDVTPGLCPRPVPTVTCVAGNGWVRSSRESPRAPAPSGGHR
jgi:hypothetical protein